MQYIDEAKIYIKAGNGGNGALSFRREKYIERGGPDGGDGGSGGSIIFKSNSHINTLIQFRFKRHFKSQNGQNGKGYNRTGKSQKPLIIEVPIGTQIFSEDGQLLLHDFTYDQEQFEILPGGKNGLGNACFKSSTNQAPRKHTKGEIGQEMHVLLKMKLLSDAGLIGLPNVGKSTILLACTSATPKIANYNFTTLKPNLGVVSIQEQTFILADIPGLIKGAHTGSGLGDRFLKHIERCSVLIHVIDANSKDILLDYKMIRKEIELYSTMIQDKQEVVCLNKIDTLSNNEVIQKIRSLEALTKQTVYPVSGYTHSGIDILLKQTLNIVQMCKSKI